MFSPTPGDPTQQAPKRALYVYVFIAVIIVFGFIAIVLQQGSGLKSSGQDQSQNSPVFGRPVKGYVSTGSDGVCTFAMDRFVREMGDGYRVEPSKDMAPSEAFKDELRCRTDLMAWENEAVEGSDDKKRGSIMLSLGSWKDPAALKTAAARITRGAQRMPTAQGVTLFGQSLYGYTERWFTEGEIDTVMITMMGGDNASMQAMTGPDGIVARIREIFPPSDRRLEELDPTVTIDQKQLDAALAPDFISVKNDYYSPLMNVTEPTHVVYVIASGTKPHAITPDDESLRREGLESIPEALRQTSLENHERLLLAGSDPNAVLVEFLSIGPGLERDQFNTLFKNRVPATYGSVLTTTRVGAFEVGSLDRVRVWVTENNEPFQLVVVSPLKTTDSGVLEEVTNRLLSVYPPNREKLEQYVILGSKK